MEAIRERLHKLVTDNLEIAAFVERNIADFNGSVGDVASLCSLEHVLNDQHFLLAYWQDPNEGINYRRFFAISDLVGVRVEDPLVFEATHDQILRLGSKNAVRGVRVDHIDGLRDPAGYLSRLQERLSANQPPGSDHPYVIVEKILARDETLPDDWTIAGTTGYEYLNAANSLFVSPDGATNLEETYFAFIDKQMTFADVMYQKKRLVMNTLLRVEMRSLGRQLINLAANDRYARNLLRLELMDVLIETTACLPYYRTYIRNLDVSEQSKQLIEQAIIEARKRRPRLSRGCFKFLRDVLTVANPPHILADQREERLAFVMRWQQFTGPIVAKGVEDTALYAYYPLLSLNEVGGNPEPSKLMSWEKFCNFIQDRQKHWPETLNAASTHDTKRSEDVRARINVLSEIPDEWATHLNAWSIQNQSRKKTLEGREVPDSNEEYLIYQTLIGLWPGDPFQLPFITKRLQDFAVKANREAAVHTRWTEPNKSHEHATSAFIEHILSPQENPAFLQDVARFQSTIAYAGMVNSLSQTLLRITCPGVPDFYQGTELWDYHLVDPDNRAPVDFPIRRTALQSLINRAKEDTSGVASELLANWTDGRIKLYIIWKALTCCRQHPSLFKEGDFLPLECSGPRSQQIISFLRRGASTQVLVILPRWLAKLPQPANERLEFWKETSVRLPPDSPVTWRNIFTQRTIDRTGGHMMPVGRVFEHFPPAMMSPD